ncbi:MAG: hypothetical protein K5985_05830, partial [Lachnospiraceae bacterium]|nr:hypothetical protein [Lachnospiraceae bacterium]
DPCDVRLFGTSSGGGQAMSLCVYIKSMCPEIPLPGKLVLQSPGLQVPPSETQKIEMNRRSYHVISDFILIIS